jgi:hypothetical protein
MPFGSHLAMDTLPSGVPQEAGSRSALAVSDFRLRARLGFTIPSFFPRPARHYPRFRIWRPSSKRQRDFNPPDLGAAQHTLWTQLTLSSSRARCVTNSTELPSSSTWPSGRRLPWKSAASCTKCRAQGPRRSVSSESDSMHSFGNGVVSDSVGCKNS